MKKFRHWVTNVYTFQNFVWTFNVMVMMIMMNCFVIWLTDERGLTLFPGRTIARGPRDHTTLTRRKHVLNLRKT